MFRNLFLALSIACALFVSACGGGGDAATSTALPLEATGTVTVTGCPVPNAQAGCLETSLPLTLSDTVRAPVEVHASVARHPA